MREVLTKLGGLQCRVLQAGEAPPKLGVVLCHGFGAPGDDLVSLAEAIVSLEPSLKDSVRFVFPEAPMSLDAYGLYGARAWWMVDVGRFQRASAQGPEALLALADDVPEGLAPARKMLHATLDAFMASTGLAMNRIVLGGFSQGAMLTTDFCLRHDEPPAALAVFSGTLLCRNDWLKRAPMRRGLEVLMSHGSQDQILPFFGAEKLRDLFTEAGLNVDFVPFQGPHTIHPAALTKFAALLSCKLSAS